MSEPVNVNAGNVSPALFHTNVRSRTPAGIAGVPAAPESLRINRSWMFPFPVAVIVFPNMFACVSSVMSVVAVLSVNVDVPPTFRIPL